MEWLYREENGYTISEATVITLLVSAVGSL